MLVICYLSFHSCLSLFSFMLVLSFLLVFFFMLLIWFNLCLLIDTCPCFMLFIIYVFLSFILGCYSFIFAYHLFIIITFILLVLILTHCHYLLLASIVTLYFLALALLCPYSLGLSYLHYLMGNLLCSLLGMHSSLSHHSVTLCLTLPIFT